MVKHEMHQCPLEGTKFTKYCSLYESHKNENPLKCEFRYECADRKEDHNRLINWLFDQFRSILK